MWTAIAHCPTVSALRSGAAISSNHCGSSLLTTNASFDPCVSSKDSSKSESAHNKLHDMQIAEPRKGNPNLKHLPSRFDARQEMRRRKRRRLLIHIKRDRWEIAPENVDHHIDVGHRDRRTFVDARVAHGKLLSMGNEIGCDLIVATLQRRFYTRMLPTEVTGSVRERKKSLRF
jgi:hypothetical protein